MTVPARRVTDWITQRYPERLSRVSFIKIDAEGFDLEVLRSVEAIVRQQKPYLHVEMYQHLPIERRQELWRYMSQLGYDIYHTEGGYGVEPGVMIQEGDVMKWAHFDVIALPKARASNRAAA